MTRAVALSFALAVAGALVVTPAAARQRLAGLALDFRIVPLDREPAPPVALESLAGARVSLAGLRGRPVILYLWRST